MNELIIDVGYLVAAILFVVALKRMASPRTARLGNLIGAIGMLIAIAFTFLETPDGLPAVHDIGWGFVLAGGVIGTVLGAALALMIRMTAMPQMVALLNGMGGLASALVVIVEVFRSRPEGFFATSQGRYLVATVGISTLIGWITFTGSIIAWAKLQEFFISGKPLLFPRQKLVNFGALGVTVLLIVLWTALPESRAVIIPLALLSAGLGVLFTIPIGGADMPVVISLLNSYSGLAACATGFVLGNAGLIISGSLVGASGIILTKLMCQAMNRSLANVLFGGVGAAVAQVAAGAEKRVRSWTADDAAMVLDSASLVIIVPGYGMAVAQAQHAVKELADELGRRGVTVKFGIHPVAGRMPGHMNVLLAEAEVPYEQLADMDEVNPEFERADAAIVIGANDVVNPAARHDKTSPIYGMPILDVDKARTVMVIKRSMNPGFAGIENELFYAPNTSMLFGDAKNMVTGILAALKKS